MKGMNIKMRLKIAITLLTVIVMVINTLVTGCKHITTAEKEDTVAGDDMKADFIKPYLQQSPDKIKVGNPVKQNLPLEIIDTHVSVKRFDVIVEHNNKIYIACYFSTEGLYRMNMDGGDREVVFAGDDFTSCVVEEEKIYYTYDDGIYSLDIKNKTKQLIADTMEFQNVYLVGDYLYYIETTLHHTEGDVFPHASERICRIKKDGSGSVEQIHEAAPNSMQISDGWIYFVDFTDSFEGSTYRNSGIYRIDYQGENKSLVYAFAENEIISIEDGVDDFTIYNDCLYYNYNSGMTGRFNMATGVKHEHKDETDQIRIYYINASSGQLYAQTREWKEEKTFDGIGLLDPETLTIKKVIVSHEYDPDFDFFGSYAQIEDWLYYFYSTEEGEKLFRIKLDGSSKEPQLITSFQMQTAK
jgi:hypothetical protein